MTIHFSDSPRGQNSVFFCNLKDGDIITFGLGPAPELVPLPDPQICNLQLAVARVSYASGASEVFDQFVEDDNDDSNLSQVPVYFGSPWVEDDFLMRRLEALVC